MVFHSVDLSTKQGRGAGEWCGSLPNATKVKLVSQDGQWCYIEGEGEFGQQEG